MIEFKAVDSTEIVPYCFMRVDTTATFTPFHDSILLLVFIKNNKKKGKSPPAMFAGFSGHPTVWTTNHQQTATAEGDNQGNTNISTMLCVDITGSDPPMLGTTQP
jgi:hypothetical protein